MCCTLILAATAIDLLVLSGTEAKSSYAGHDCQPGEYRTTAAGHEQTVAPTAAAAGGHGRDLQAAEGTCRAVETAERITSCAKASGPKALDIACCKVSSQLDLLQRAVMQVQLRLLRIFDHLMIAVGT